MPGFFFVRSWGSTHCQFFQKVTMRMIHPLSAFGPTTLTRGHELGGASPRGGCRRIASFRGAADIGNDSVSSPHFEGGGGPLPMLFCRAASAEGEAAISSRRSRERSRDGAAANHAASTSASVTFSPAGAGPGGCSRCGLIGGPRLPARRSRKVMG